MGHLQINFARLQDAWILQDFFSVLQKDERVEQTDTEVKAEDLCRGD